MLKRSYYCVFVFIVTVGVSNAGASALPPKALERVKVLAALVQDVDDRPLSTQVREIESSRHPMTQLAIREAMAKTFTDIVQQQHVIGTSKKVWLYSMVKLNMAYLQFGGGESNTALNNLILHLLKKHLPADIIDSRGFRVNLE